MKKALGFIVGLFLLISTSGVGNAAPFDLGSGSYIDLSNTDSALTMYANMNPALDSYA